MQHTLINGIREINPKLDYMQAKEISDSVYHYAKLNGLDPVLVASVIAVESSFKSTAIGTKGEIGLMQLRPEFHLTHVTNLKKRKEYLRGINTNIIAGTKYIASLKAVFGQVYGDIRFIEHYNRGPYSRPKKFTYASKVYAFYKRLGGKGEQYRDFQPNKEQPKSESRNRALASQ